MISRIQVDTRGTQRGLETIARQMPFIASRTTNGLALAAQRRVREELPQHFTLRRPEFIRGSIRVTLGNKQNPTAEVGVPPRPRSGIHESLALQEFGGIERAEGGGSLAQPLAARPTPLSVTPPSKWPSKLKRSFKVETAKGDTFILQRVGGRRSRKQAIHGPVQEHQDPRLKVMYKLRPEVPVRARWGFVQTCVDVAKREAQAIFAREFTNAMRTAR